MALRFEEIIAGNLQRKAISASTRADFDPGRATNWCRGAVLPSLEANSKNKNQKGSNQVMVSSKMMRKLKQK